MSLVLDTITKSIEIFLGGAVAANELEWTTHYADYTTAGFTPINSHGVTNGAADVTMVAAPAASTQRLIQNMTVFNADTAAVTVTIQLHDTVGPVDRRLVPVTLPVGYSLHFREDQWQVLDTNGAMVTTAAAHQILSSAHSDAATDVVSRGSIQIGNVTPEWDELVIGTTDQVVGTADGVDTTFISTVLAFLSTNVPFNSEGNAFATVQAAIDDLEAGPVPGWVFVPRGTWTETLVIAQNDITLFGTGWGSIVDGALAGHAINVTGVSCIVRDLQCRTTQGGTNNFDGLRIGVDGNAIRVYVSAADRDGVHVVAGGLIRDCKVANVDETGIFAIGAGARVQGNDIRDIGEHGISTNLSGDDTVIIGNYVDTTGDDGIYLDPGAENCVVDGNRITAWTNECIDDDSGTSTIGDNDCT